MQPIPRYFIQVTDDASYAAKMLQTISHTKGSIDKKNSDKQTG